MTTPGHPITLSIRGRTFTPRQLRIIVEITDEYFADTRTELSERICRALGWRQPNGRLKDVACREVLRRLNDLRLIALPQPLAVGAQWNRDAPVKARIAEDSSPVTQIEGRDLTVEPISTKADADLWNFLVTRHHYLRSSRIVGRQLKYVVRAQGRVLACIGWGDAAWEVQARDRWIGWTPAQRSRYRALVVANVRFLILPWVRVPNLASRILSITTRRLPQDWRARYALEPVLLETFVDTSRFIGTCYRAANWLPIGTTSGYAKVGPGHHNSQQPKALFLYPLQRHFRRILRGSRL